MIPNDPARLPPRIITPESIDKSFPWNYFDGSTQQIGCGGGVTLHMNELHFYKLKIRLGKGTNNYVELSCLKSILTFSLTKVCKRLQNFSDSKIIIDWLNEQTICHMHTLRNFLDEVLLLKSQFDFISCRYIYMERNQVSDSLSKEATHLLRDHWEIQEHNDHQYY